MSRNLPAGAELLFDKTAALRHKIKHNAAFARKDGRVSR